MDIKCQRFYQLRRCQQGLQCAMDSKEIDHVAVRKQQNN